MSQKQKPDLAAALANAGGSTRRRSAPLRSQEPTSIRQKAAPAQEAEAEESKPGYQPPCRSGTVPITGHFPRQLRDQLKILAIERGGTLHNLMAEAYNDLFAKYGKAEIAPHQSMVEQ